jgi:hypothetical protein
MGVKRSLLLSKEEKRSKDFKAKMLWKIHDTGKKVVIVSDIIIV